MKSWCSQVVAKWVVANFQLVMRCEKRVGVWMRVERWRELSSDDEGFYSFRVADLGRKGRSIAVAAHSGKNKYKMMSLGRIEYCRNERQEPDAFKGCDLDRRSSGCGPEEKESRQFAWPKVRSAGKGAVGALASRFQ